MASNILAFPGDHRKSGRERLHTAVNKEVKYDVEINKRFVLGNKDEVECCVRVHLVVNPENGLVSSITEANRSISAYSVAGSRGSHRTRSVQSSFPRRILKASAQSWFCRCTERHAARRRDSTDGPVNEPRKAVIARKPHEMNSKQYHLTKGMETKT